MLDWELSSRFYKESAAVMKGNGGAEALPVPIAWGGNVPRRADGKSAQDVCLNVCVVSHGMLQFPQRSSTCCASAVHTFDADPPLLEMKGRRNETARPSNWHPWSCKQQDCVPLAI